MSDRLKSRLSLNTLAANPYDVPFALVYLLDEDAREAHLIRTSGIEHDSTAAPALITMNDGARWPLREVFETDAPKVISDVEQRFGSLPGGPWPESCNTALILPIGASGHAKPSGFLVAGLSPRRIFDAEYRSFLELVVGHIGTAI